ncbi:MAG: LysM peptidoglycan-binding domain-containing protein [Tepidiformaceae bacterium]
MNRARAVSLLGATLLLAATVAACGGKSSPGSGGNGPVNTDPATVPSSTPIQNPIMYHISQDGSVQASCGPPITAVPGTNVTPAAGKTYSVASGDSCSSIAGQYGITSAELMTQNRTINSDCTNLHVGDVLQIPGQTAAEAGTGGGGAGGTGSSVGNTGATLGTITTPVSGGVAPTTTVLGGTGANATPTPNGKAKFYTVASGDTCSAIAGSYGVKVSDIIALNDLDADCTLHVGQLVQIPE